MQAWSARVEHTVCGCGVCQASFINVRLGLSGSRCGVTAVAAVTAVTAIPNRWLVQALSPSALQPLVGSLWPPLDKPTSASDFHFFRSTRIKSSCATIWAVYRVSHNCWNYAEPANLPIPVAYSCVKEAMLSSAHSLLYMSSLLVTSRTPSPIP